ncbi:hypothetical protein K474DRAFT_1513940 [Panus rudis PR-1116 ss-1]|nr:hypothetical protein K474DRAFT_1513940 [Panus rudis PR-1116 ss-1]
MGGRIPWIELLLAAYLGVSGVRKRSLSPSGGIAAFIVGFCMFNLRLRAFGVALVVFYLTGSKATKVGKELKAKLEEGHQEAGYRNAAQVLCNSFSAFVAALLWKALFEPGSWISRVLEGTVLPSTPYDSAQWCAISPAVADGKSRALLFITLGHFACCLGDTLASELGILSKSPPRLITTLRTVPPGTNGGVSLTGTLASVAGGVIMGLTMAFDLLVESKACRGSLGEVFSVVAWGAAAGLLGSLLDSVMGATIQRTRYSEDSKRILTDESGVPKSVTSVKVISGIDILSNNQVNLLSSIVTAATLAYLA